VTRGVARQGRVAEADEPANPPPVAE